MSVVFILFILGYMCVMCWVMKHYSMNVYHSSFLLLFLQKLHIKQSQMDGLHVSKDSFYTDTIYFYIFFKHTHTYTYISTNRLYFCMGKTKEFSFAAIMPLKHVLVPFRFLDVLLPSTIYG